MLPPAVKALVRSRLDVVEAWERSVAGDYPLILTFVSLLLASIFATFFLHNLLYPEAYPRRYHVAPAHAPDERPVQKTCLRLPDNPDVIQCYAPATGRFLGFVQPATPDVLDDTIQRAAKAQRTSGWATTTFRQRRAVLRSLLQHVLDHQHEICRVACLDSGKTLVDAQLGEILVTVEKLNWTLKHGEAALRPSRRPTNMLMTHKHNEVRYEPLGVVAALVSWNYPFHNFIGPVISALFAGNAIIVKVSEQTAWSSRYFQDIVRGALLAHAHSPDLVQTVACWPEHANHLTSHPGIAHVTFIGSRPICHHVAQATAKSLTPLVAELGGKDPAILLDSAAHDISRIVPILMRGTFQSAGQNCIGIERIIVTPKLYDQVVADLAPRVPKLRLGPEADVGAMISPHAFERLEALVQDAVAKGARLLAGGKRYHHPDFPLGHYFEPTLLVDVTPEMDVAREECFGPIMTVMRAASASAQDVLAVANAPDFGLGASVFGGDRDPVLLEVVAGLRAGNVAVNDFGVFYVSQLPFGGVGGSGYGRFAGEEGLRGLCNAKSVSADRLGWLGVRTAIPPPVQYPVPNQEKSWLFTQGVVELGYGLTIPRQIAGLVRLLQNMGRSE